jgi:hypothetical protein
VKSDRDSAPESRDGVSSGNAGRADFSAFLTTANKSSINDPLNIPQVVRNNSGGRPGKETALRIQGEGLYR